VEDWESLENYARQASNDKAAGLYQLLENDGKVEVRVLIGKCGYKTEFENADDHDLMDILDFCWKQRFTKVCANIQDSIFFNP
jgi:hypothetical protein